MKSVGTWIAERRWPSAFVAALAAFVSLQLAGYGISLKEADLLCALILASAAAGFQYQFVDHIAKLDARHSRPNASEHVEFKLRVEASLIGAFAFLLSALSVVMLSRLQI